MGMRPEDQLLITVKSIVMLRAVVAATSARVFAPP